MEISYFLAKAFGLYLLIISIAILVKRTDIKTQINDLIESPGLNLFISIFTLILGILAVLAHNIWIFSWPVLVTLLAWLTFIKGIVRLFAPDSVNQLGLRLFDNAKAFYIMVIINLLLGLFLLYKGFGF